MVEVSPLILLAPSTHFFYSLVNSDKYFVNDKFGLFLQ